MKIKELEILLSISRSNIRFYEKQGLFSPERKDNNYREYTEQDIKVLKKIIILRKMGFTVEEIKLIQNNELSFTEAMTNAQQRIEDEIEQLNGSLKFIKQVAKKNSSFDEFDIEEHWNTIIESEKSGEKFIDIYKDFLELERELMRRLAKILFPISVALFICSISLGLLGRAFCTRSNNDYKSIQPESFVPDTIETVLYDEDLKQIYICYNDANCVNVYSEEGKFLWCVATPYMRNSYFELQDDKLIICDGDAYIYDSQNGSFLGLENEEKLNLTYDWENEYDDQFTEGNFYFDSFQVYKASADGTLDVIVNRPWWHHIFDYPLCLGLAFLGTMGIGISIFLEKKKDYYAVRKTVVFENYKAKFIKNYFKATTIIHTVYTALNIICAFFTDWLIIGIIPLALHMIISSIILWNMKDRLSCKSEEMQVINFWGTTEIGSFVIAFISVIIASSIAG